MHQSHQVQELSNLTAFHNMRTLQLFLDFLRCRESCSTLSSHKCLEWAIPLQMLNEHLLEELIQEHILRIKLLTQVQILS